MAPTGVQVWHVDVDNEQSVVPATAVLPPAETARLSAVMWTSYLPVGGPPSYREALPSCPHQEKITRSSIWRPARQPSPTA
jgi:hypothetical protein